MLNPSPKLRHIPRFHHKHRIHETSHLTRQFRILWHVTLLDRFYFSPFIHKMLFIPLFLFFFPLFCNLFMFSSFMIFQNIPIHSISKETFSFLSICHTCRTIKETRVKKERSNKHLTKQIKITQLYTET